MEQGKVAKMSDTYDNRNGAKATASGGTLNTTVTGLTGCLAPGVYDLEVMSVMPSKGRVGVILQAPNGHMHFEALTTWPANLGVGAKLRGTISPSQRGYVVQRHTDRYRAERADNLEPLTDWCDTIGALLAAVPKGWRPATTELTEVTHDGGKFQPRLYRATGSTEGQVPEAPTKGPAKPG